jgi:gamma-glutamyl-gamma-aminobutyrate hydrolase PuuD
VKNRPVIAVTQRVDSFPGRNEVRDTLDQSWTKFLDQAGFELLPVSNMLRDPVAYLRSIGVSGIVLSGGNDVTSAFAVAANVNGLVPSDEGLDAQPGRDRTEILLLQASLESGWPVMGVCRGMQAMNVAHGGGLEPLDGHVRTHHALSISARAHFVFDPTVNSYHCFGVTDATLAPGFECIARAGDSVEAMWHPDYRHLGIMWHPERNIQFSTNDLALFRALFGAL